MPISLSVYEAVYVSFIVAYLVNAYDRLAYELDLFMSTAMAYAYVYDKLQIGTRLNSRPGGLGLIFKLRLIQMDYISYLYTDILVILST